MTDTGDGDDALAKYVELHGQARAGDAARRDRVVQQRVAVGRRPGDREGHRQDVRAGDQGAAVRAARARQHLLLHERHHDAAVRRRAPPGARRHDQGRPPVGAAAGRRARRRHLGQRRRPDQVGPLPPRRRHRGRRHAGPVAGAARPDEAADRRHAGQRARRLRRHQLAAPRRRRRADRRPRRHDERPALGVPHGARAGLRASPR